MPVFDGRHVQPHCVTCNCAARYEVFGSNPLFNFQTISGKSSNCTSLRKMHMNNAANDRIVKSYGSSEGDSNYRINRNLKARKLSHSHSPRTDDDDDDDDDVNDDDDECNQPTTPKLRVSNNLMECEPSIPLNGNKAVSTTSSETISPDFKSIGNNAIIDDNDDNDSNESLRERRESENIVSPVYDAVTNEYYAQRQAMQLAQQQAQQHIYEEQTQQQFDHQFQQTQFTGSYTQNEESGNLRQRKERMSKRQKELYVEFLEQNPVVNKHRRNDPFLDIFWLRLANILNSCPNGAAKSVAEWKQAFDNWRYRVFLYARHNSQLNEDDAMNSKAFKPLTRTDKRAYNLWIRNPDTAPANTEKLPNDLVCTED